MVAGQRCLAVARVTLRSRQRCPSISSSLQLSFWRFLRSERADYGDNAYLYIPWIGFWPIAVSVPFALATVLPEGGLRRIVVLLGVAVLLLFGGLSSLGLIGSLAIIPSQDYPTSQAFVSHLLGLRTLVSVVFVVFVGYRFMR